MAYQRLEAANSDSPPPRRRRRLGYLALGVVSVIGVTYAGAAYFAGDSLRSRFGKIVLPDGEAGTFYRDPTPGLTALQFWDLAQREIKESGVDTCGDKLGKKLVDAYVAHSVNYCNSNEPGPFAPVELEDKTHSHWAQPGPPGHFSSRIQCFPVHRDNFSSWWPYPASPCVSTNLHTRLDWKYDARCTLTQDGVDLRNEMGKEGFVGNNLDIMVGDKDCTSRVERTVLIIGRQDQWNPFHVGEDLVTTLVTLFIATTAIPKLAKERLQLVFTDQFGMDANHFTPLYDRMGAWAPRRLTLDPWKPGECLTNAIHSVGAGASLLSAMGVGTSDKCSSSITWAAAHYYRHLFGLHPRKPRSINVLYLSREKHDAHKQTQEGLSKWQEYRHLTNDAELIAALRHRLADMCSSGSCVFQDERDEPQSWGNEPGLRFAVIDPTVHAIETQIHYAGHADIILAQHGGALGLALFLPPGQASIIEMQVEHVAGNYHFEHLAAQTGQQYEQIRVEKTVNIDQLWGTVKRHVEDLRKRR